MEAKDKALELVDKAMGTLIFNIKQNIEADTITVSKILAINTVNEIIKEFGTLYKVPKETKYVSYWEWVKEEIEKL
ncbi:hypothetical protein H8R23_15420 [Flavobacterium sp. F-380]|uniref:Uncharacterized protein n=1 Tax=Flavobacterium kayseriense TaxID=2764714 RepID=A0ABR7JB93_9FLAO|nr:hypothetical protein [Flavobacterium kayseriense]MBC5842803.1 hypothetical protein [Flavobacterium kayseriense]MBC5849333.1 hypothetical protein [Flavobacterium kayseriense]